jgi:LysM repeat protein
MDPRSRRSPARFLAPAALAGVLIVLFAIVSAGGGSNTSASQTTPAAQTGTSGATTHSRRSAAGTGTTGAFGAKSYTVKVGDTLGGIAGKTGVPLSKIQELNPNVDPHALTAGQKIRLR